MQPFTKIRGLVRNKRALANVFILSALGLLLLPFGNACAKMELGKGFVTTLESIAGPSDIYFSQQWSLINIGQSGGTPGEDVNVMPVWSENIYGNDVLVAVVDDGADLRHPDLIPNVAEGLSHNYNDLTTNPITEHSSCDLASCHGTAVAGVAVGAINGIGMVGVAPKAKLAVYNFILSDQADATEQDAMVRNAAVTGVSNNSWGPGGGGTGDFRPSSAAWRAGIDTGLSTGRGGKGINYFFAAGNGAQSILDESKLGDTSNQNGYANYYGVSAVCAVDHKGIVTFYSESGANLWVCGPSHGFQSTRGILTADMIGDALGYNQDGVRSELSNRDYSHQFSGTSAAAPAVSGVAALVIDTRPELSWRDVRIILARSARKNHPSSTGWQQNGASPPYNIHYDYGFGVVDANAAVQLAKIWTPVSANLESFSQNAAVNIPIDDAGAIASSSITVAGSGIDRIEYVEITTNITHADWGNLVIDLKRSGAGSPATASRLLLNHHCSDDGMTEVNCTVTGNTFRFGSTRHLGEAADGVWTLEVRDGDALDNNADTLTGSLTGWTIKFYGE